MSEKISLSKATEFELKGNVTIKVFPASLETYSQLAPKLRELDAVGKETIENQVALFVEIVYALVKDDNEVNKDQLKKVLTIEACTKIIQTAMGAFSGVA